MIFSVSLWSSPSPHCLTDLALLLYENSSVDWESSKTPDSRSPTRRILELREFSNSVTFFVTVFTVYCVRFHMSFRHHLLSHYFIWFTLEYDHLRCFSDYFCLKIFKIDIFQNWIKTLSFSVISSFNIFRESVALALLNRLSMASVRELEWRLRELHNIRLTQSNKEKPRTQYFFLNFFWNSFYCLLCAISHVLSSPSAFTLFYMVHAQV